MWQSGKEGASPPRLDQQGHPGAMFGVSKQGREEEGGKLEEWLEETSKSGRVRPSHVRGCSWILTAVGAIEGFCSPDAKCPIDPYAPAPDPPRCALQ